MNEDVRRKEVYHIQCAIIAAVVVIGVMNVDTRLTK